MYGNSSKHGSKNPTILHLTPITPDVSNDCLYSGPDNQKDALLQVRALQQGLRGDFPAQESWQIFRRANSNASGCQAGSCLPGIQPLKLGSASMGQEAHELLLNHLASVLQRVVEVIGPQLYAAHAEGRVEHAIQAASQTMTENLQLLLLLGRRKMLNHLLTTCVSQIELSSRAEPSPEQAALHEQLSMSCSFLSSYMRVHLWEADPQGLSGFFKRLAACETGPPAAETAVQETAAPSVAPETRINDPHNPRGQPEPGLQPCCADGHGSAAEGLPPSNHALGRNIDKLDPRDLPGYGLHTKDSTDNENPAEPPPICEQPTSSTSAWMKEMGVKHSIPR